MLTGATTGFIGPVSVALPGFSFAAKEESLPHIPSSFFPDAFAVF